MIEIPTSGTTGEKKICLVTEEAFEARHEIIKNHYGVENLVGFSFNPFYNRKKVFILGACEKFGKITQDITEAKIIVFIQKSQHEFGALDLLTLKKAINCKYFVCGGMDIGEENWKILQNTLPHSKILSQYGMAEAGAICVTDGQPVKGGVVGKPYKGVEIKVENNNIYVKSRGLMVGYKEKEQVDEWFNTEDKGYMDRHGNLYLYGARV
jgi:long-subunit acyl-CoA synthetase (AMP-forming)